MDTNILDLTKAELAEYLILIGQPKYRADQLYQTINPQNVPKHLRALARVPSGSREPGGGPQQKAQARRRRECHRGRAPQARGDRSAPGVGRRCAKGELKGNRAQRRRDTTRIRRRVCRRDGQDGSCKKRRIIKQRGTLCKMSAKPYWWWTTTISS